MIKLWNGKIYYDWKFMRLRQPPFYCSWHWESLPDTAQCQPWTSLVADERWVHREPHDHGTYSPGLHEERTIKELKLQTRLMTFLIFCFKNSFWLEMIESMILEHCSTQTLAVYVNCAHLVFYSFRNWLLVLFEHRSLHPNARRRQRCSPSLLATSYWFCTQRNFVASNLW